MCKSSIAGLKAPHKQHGWRGERARGTTGARQGHVDHARDRRAAPAFQRLQLQEDQCAARHFAAHGGDAYQEHVSQARRSFGGRGGDARGAARPARFHSLTNPKEAVMKRTTLQTALACALPALLSGCYIVPVGPEAMARLNTLLEQAQAPSPAAPQGATQPAKPAAVEPKVAAAAPA